jgi:hypothetical protein
VPGVFWLGVLLIVFGCARFPFVVRKLSKASSAGPTPANEEQRYIELQELLVTVGLGLFVVGYIPAGIWAQQGVQAGNYVQYSWLWLLFGIFQSAGLITLTFADIDINAFAKRHKGRTGIFASIFLSFNAAAAYSLLTSPGKGDGWSLKFVGSALSLPMLPFIYMFAFFTPVLGMQDGYPRFSVLVVMALILSWFGYGVYLIFYAWSGCLTCAYGASQSTPEGVAGIGTLLESFLIAFYYQQQSRNNSRTIALNATIYAYLLANGVTDLLSRIPMACAYGIQSAVPNWLFG